MPESPSVFDRIRTTRIGPRGLLVLAAVLIGVYLLFTRTDLWYVLLP